MAKIIFAGDSNLDQYVTNAEKFGSIVGSARGYPFVTNSGVSGNTSAQLLARLASDVIAPDPDVCAVMIGTNDMAAAHENDTANSAMIAAYVANMEEIIDDLEAASIVPVIVTPPPARIPEVCLRFPAMLAALDALCTDKSVALVNIYDAIADRARNVSKAAFQALYLADPDKYHLSVAGHSFIGGLDWSSIPAATLPAIDTVLNEAHNSNFGNISGGTFRVAIEMSAMSLPGSVTMARLTFQGHSDEPLALSKVFAGSRSSGANASSLVPVRVGGAQAFTVPQAGTLVSDPFPFGGGAMLVTGHGNGGSSADKLSAKSSATGATTYYKYGDEAASLSVTGFAGYSGYLSLVTEIETDGF